ncbi:lysine-rich nucleolar protein 1 [Dryobates pubescens]|nr:lysine-rich nucleolar protein 1 [Dryobates pubescens]
MIVKKKRKDHEEPVQKKKKVKSSRSQTIIKIEKDVQIVIKTEDDDQLQTKTKVKKKEKFKEDECLDRLELKRKKKKKKTKKDSCGSELLKETHSESFMHLKGHLDTEPQEEPEEQIKSLKKKKKKMHCHSSLSLENNQSADVELSNHHTDGTKENEFAYKKSRKKADSNVGGEETKRKKKKGVFSLEGIQDSEQKQSENICKKKHKCISQQKAFRGQSCATAMVQNDEESYVRRKKKKKIKEKSDSISPLADNQYSTCEVPDGTITLSDCRKRQRTLTNREEEDTAENSGSIREAKREKKGSKNVSSITYKDNPAYSQRGAGKHLPAQQEVKLVEEELSGKKGRKNIKDHKVSKKKKKKMQKEEEKETTYSKVYLTNDSAFKSQKPTVLESNKKDKESEMKQAQYVTGDTVDRVLCNSNHVLCDRKSKKRRKEAPQDCAKEPGSNASAKKIKKEDMRDETLGHMDDVTIVQEKKGNADEVNIDKVRRQALQEEIDRESGKTKMFSPKVERDPTLGQWSTATFQSPEKEMKFFRLMGGFKKGSSVSIQNLSATTNKANMALNKEGEEKLQQTLKMEFDKAMNLKQHRGVGLGFQPAANKKVYIDKYTTRSIKFED